MAAPRVLTRSAAALDGRAPTTVRRLRGAWHQLEVARLDWHYRDYPDPGRPFGRRYMRNRGRMVAASLADRALIGALAAGDALPASQGAGFDERAVELPWLLSRAPFGRLLDAGSALNHAYAIDSFMAAADALTIVTGAPEPVSFTERGVSYLYADLRDLPFRDAAFDTVACVSTLEHIGMDNSRWGNPMPRSADPAGEGARAVAELARLVAPGGRMLMTLPYGASEDQGWFQQPDRHGLDDLVAAAAGLTQASIEVFAYGRDGWVRSDLEAAAGAHYQRDHAPAADPATEDRAPAARAVACIELRR